MSSIPFDWYARLWVEANFTATIVRPFPVPGRSITSPEGRRLIELAAGQFAGDERFISWSKRVGTVDESQVNDQTKSTALAEIDALASLLYKLEWRDVEVIFETFHRGWDYSERLAAVKIHYDAWKARA